MKLLSTLAVVMVAFGTMSITQAAPTILIGVDSRQTYSIIREIDPATGLSSILGYSPYGQLLGLAYDPISNQLLAPRTYYDGTGLPTQSADLLNISANTIIGSLGFGNVQGLAFDSSNNLYGVESPLFRPFNPSDFQSVLLEIDKASGVATAIGSIGVGSVIGISFDSTDRLFGTNRFRTSVPNFSEELLMIDPIDGSSSVVGAFPSTLFNAGLAFDWTGTLYGASDRDDSLFSIDLLTGAPTIIGPFVQTCCTNMAGLTFAPHNVDLSGLLAEPPPEPEPVPEPGILALFAIGLAGIGLARPRRIA